MTIYKLTEQEKLNLSKWQCSQKAVKPTNRSLTELEIYQQALSDFCIEELLEKISNYCDADFDAAKMHLESPEIELLAAIFVQQLTQNINGKLISGYLNAIRHENSELLPTSLNQEIQSPSVGLPNDYPNVEIPHYLEGKTVQWKSPLENTDWGIVIGRFYSYASHLGRWTWKYIVLLDENSPSSAWCLADTAWEEDLQEVDCEK